MKSMPSVIFSFQESDKTILPVQQISWWSWLMYFHFCLPQLKKKKSVSLSIPQNAHTLSTLKQRWYFLLLFCIYSWLCEWGFNGYFFMISRDKVNTFFFLKVIEREFEATIVAEEKKNRPLWRHQYNSNLLYFKIVEQYYFLPDCAPNYPWT